MNTLATIATAAAAEAIIRDAESGTPGTYNVPLSVGQHNVTLSLSTIVRPGRAAAEPHKAADGQAMAIIIDAVRAAAAADRRARVAKATEAIVAKAAKAKAKLDDALSARDAEAIGRAYVEHAKAAEAAKAERADAKAAAEAAWAETPMAKAADAMVALWGTCRGLAFTIPGSDVQTTMAAVLSAVRPGDVGRAYAGTVVAKAKAAKAKAAPKAKAKAAKAADRAAKAIAPKAPRSARIMPKAARRAA